MFPTLASLSEIYNSVLCNFVETLCCICLHFVEHLLCVCDVIFSLFLLELKYALLLYRHIWFQVSNEETKSAEISKLQKALESLKLELDASKLSTINECNKNAVMKNQLELAMKEKSVLDREVSFMVEVKKENDILKVRVVWLIYF